VTVGEGEEGDGGGGNAGILVTTPTTCQPEDRTSTSLHE
jgi:hypothetical protein